MNMQGTGDDGGQGDGNDRKRKAGGQPEDAQINRRSRRKNNDQSSDNIYAKPRGKSYGRQSSNPYGRTRGASFDKKQQELAEEKKRKADEQAEYEKNLADEYKNRVRAPKGQRGDGQLHIVFIQMGQGDCAIISTPAGKSILVDCGSTATEEMSEIAYKTRIRNVLLGPKFLKDKQKLDMLLLTHPDKDHHAKLKTMLKGIITEIGVFYHSCEFSEYSLNQTSTWIDKILADNRIRANKQVMCCDDGEANPRQFRRIKPLGKVVYALPHTEMPNEQIDARGAIRILHETDQDITTTTTTIPSRASGNDTSSIIQPPVNMLNTGANSATSSIISPPLPSGTPPVHSTLPAATNTTPVHSTLPPSANTIAVPSSTEDIPFDMDIDLNIELKEEDFLLSTVVSPPPPTVPPPPPIVSPPPPIVSSPPPMHTATPQAATTSVAATICDIAILASNVYMPSALDKRDGTDGNRQSIVLLIEAYGRKIMICGDATGGTEEFILRAYPDVRDLDVLQVPHHGSDLTSSTPAFVSQMNPENCIISAPKDASQHGHPCATVIKAYRKNPRIGKNLPVHTIFYKKRDKEYQSLKSSVVEQITDAIYITGSYGSCSVTVSETGQLTISTLEVAAADQTTTTITTPQSTSGTHLVQITLPASQPQPQLIAQTTIPVMPQTPSVVQGPEPISIDTDNTKSQ